MLIWLFSLCYSKPGKTNVNKNIEETVQKIQYLSKDLSNLKFRSDYELDPADDNAIDIVLEDKEILENERSKGMFSGLNSFFKKDDIYLKGTCSNCIKVAAHSAILKFRAIRKSTVNKIKYYQNTEDDCSVKEAQFIFLMDNSVVYKTETLTLNRVFTFTLPNSISFDKIHVKVTSGNPSLVCFGELSLTNKQ
ncbi:hypothetical protein TRFO_21353 [Tritrichomonas foetus]|uniref:Uncharacterized protein n=1 Tax=Tritrichomonas foetus TaxID=1144522 RepID=A0A1J4KF38_9EUKA|nr:hypothetical protein TRFO_21353 [Tritrichomonas foetus]|eukprot:OHT09642.1 hypothetical protein TRFO_21353 [Tritrichomonas foetus]